MESKLNEYKLKMLQEFAFILWGVKEILDETDVETLKQYINEKKNTETVSLFYYKAGIVAGSVTQRAILFDSQDDYRNCQEAMKQFMDEIFI